MRLTENIFDGEALYLADMKVRVEEVYRTACRLSRLRSLLDGIKAGGLSLRAVILTAEEKEKNKSLSDDFEQRLQKAMFGIIKNLSAYQQRKWKEVVGDE